MSAHSHGLAERDAVGPFSWYAVTDRGLVRRENQDRYLADAAIGLFVVCDGMGGHADGRRASSVACKVIRSVVRETLHTRCDDGDRARAILVRAVMCANQRVHALQGDPTRHPGTTVVALLWCGATVAVVHVGDSRVHRLRDGGLEQLTIDHRHPWGPRHRLSRAVGTHEAVEVDGAVRSVKPRDVFLLCSDGLEVLEPAALRSGLELAPYHAARELRLQTLRKGAPDNLTAIVVRATDGGGA